MTAQLSQNRVDDDDVAADADFRPLFLTNKLTIKHLSSNLNVYDYQLRDHYIQTNDLYVLQCGCIGHKHNKVRCDVVDRPFCVKCRRPTYPLLNYRSLLFHYSAINVMKMSTCCGHIHSPPCGRCLNCQTFRPCIVPHPFICNVTTDVICPLNASSFTTAPPFENVRLHEHINDIKAPTFFVCHEHAHRHAIEPAHTCFIQNARCCAAAVLIKDWTKCFVITITNAPLPAALASAASTNLHMGLDMPPDAAAADALGALSPLPTPAPSSSSSSSPPPPPQPLLPPSPGDVARRPLQQLAQYIIFDPSIWREQSLNNFISLLRAIIASPDVVAERYKRFASSTFTISNIKKYRSGKESIIRTAITGFETKALYQTAIISCRLPYYVVQLPQKLYRIAEEAGCDMRLAFFKRDPGIKTTCMYVCLVQQNPDPTIDVIVINDEQSKGWNQDQDGDKNAGYLIMKRRQQYDATESYPYKLAKLEMANAFRVKRTLIATPRYLFSETTLLLIERHRAELLADRRSSIFRRTYRRGPHFMNEACAGYLHREYDTFNRQIIELIDHPSMMTFVTIDDILLETDRLPSIVSSRAKGSDHFLQMLLENIRSSRTLMDNREAMIELVNKYITSSQDLSRNGRKQFTALYAAQDLCSFNGNVYLNKVCCANYTHFASCGLFLFNEASLELFVEDLAANWRRTRRSTAASSWGGDGDMCDDEVCDRDYDDADDADDDGDDDDDDDKGDDDAPDADAGGTLKNDTSEAGAPTPMALQ